MNTQAEAAVKKLARLPANQICANCGTTQRHGFNTVCIKYLSFVCNLCKTAHQAVSHRCKSLTMSSWDAGEVLKLKKHGNEYVRRVWLANAPGVGEGGRPREGDDVTVFKRFVVAAYDQKRYYQDNNTGGGGRNGLALESPIESEQPIQSLSRGPSNAAKKRSERKKKAQPVDAPIGFSSGPSSNAAMERNQRKKKIQPAYVTPAPIEQPIVDLLDFGAVEISTPPVATASDDDDFGDFSQAAVVVHSTTGSAPPPPATFDPFGDSNFLAPAPAAASSSIPANNQMSSVVSPAGIHATSNSPNDAIFDPFKSDSGGGVTSNANSNGIMQQQRQQNFHPQFQNPAMNHTINNASGINNRMNSSSMMNNMGNNTGGFGTGNGGARMNNSMQNGMTHEQQQQMMMMQQQQQQMMMMQQQQQQQNNFGMAMNGNGMYSNNMMMNGQQGVNNGMMMQNGGMNPQQQQQMMMMQHQNNNFGVSMSSGTMSSNKTSKDGKTDQFAF